MVRDGGVFMKVVISESFSINGEVKSIWIARTESGRSVVARMSLAGDKTPSTSRADSSKIKHLFKNLKHVSPHQNSFLIGTKIRKILRWTQTAENCLKKAVFQSICQLMSNIELKNGYRWVQQKKYTWKLSVPRCPWRVRNFRSVYQGRMRP